MRLAPIQPAIVLFAFCVASLTCVTSGLGEEDVKQALLTVNAEQPKDDDEKTPAEAKQEKRLKAFFAAHSAHVSSVCKLSSDQDQQLAECAKTLIAETQDGWGNGKRAAQQAQQVRRAAIAVRAGDMGVKPFQFTNSGAAGTALASETWTKGLRRILEPEQFLLLKRERERRAASQSAAIADYIVMDYDRYLFLGMEQKEQFGETLKSKLGDRIFSGLFLTKQQYTVFSRINIGDEIPQDTLEEILTDQQLDQFSRLSKQDNSNRYIMFQVSKDPEQMQNSMSAGIEQQKQRLMLAMSLQNSRLTNDFPLDNDQIRRLSVAAKGSVMRCLETWEDRTWTTLLGFQKRNVNRNGVHNIGLSVPNLDETLSHSVWSNAVRQYLDPQQLKEWEKSLRARQNSTRQMTADYLTAVFDQELSLNQDQWLPLRNLVSKALPKSLRQRENYDIEVRLLSDVIHRIKPDDIGEILNESQVEAWNALKDMFKLDKNKVVSFEVDGGTHRWSLSRD